MEQVNDYLLVENLTHEDLTQINNFKNELCQLIEDIKDNESILKEDGIVEELLQHRSSLIELLNDNHFNGEADV